MPPVYRAALCQPEQITPARRKRTKLRKLCKKTANKIANSQAKKSPKTATKTAKKPSEKIALDTESDNQGEMLSHSNFGISDQQATFARYVVEGKTLVSAYQEEMYKDEGSIAYLTRPACLEM